MAPRSIATDAGRPMTPADHLLLTQLLLLAGLIAGTAEYGEIIQRRARRRDEDAERRAAEAAGLRGLVRVFLAER